MRISLIVAGGFAPTPQSVKPIVLNSRQLSPQNAERLRELVQQARFFALPKRVGSVPRGAADFEQYTITVQQGRLKHTVRTTELNDNPPLRELIDYVRAVVPTDETRDVDKKIIR
jgi:hypothetical protein